MHFSGRVPFLLLLRPLDERRKWKKEKFGAREGERRGKSYSGAGEGGGDRKVGGKREDQGRGDLSFSLAESRGKKVKECKVTKMIEIVEMRSVETPPLSLWNCLVKLLLGSLSTKANLQLRLQM